MISNRATAGPGKVRLSATGRAPRVSVVMLTCRAEEEHLTADCIRSLQQSDYPSLDVVLVDNGAPRDGIERLRNAFPGVTIVSTGENLGFTGGNNRGIAVALERGCEYVLVLNNDTIVTEDCVSRLVEAGETHSGVGAVGAKIVYHDEPARIWFGGGEFSPMRGLGLHRLEGKLDPDPTQSGVEEVTFLTGCCMLIPAEVLQKVGGFEEDFFIYVEDVELCHRMLSAGYRLLYQPAARLAHRIPVEEPPIPPHKIVLRDRNRRRLIRRRFSPLGRLRFALFFYPTRAIHAIRYLTRGDRERLQAIWQGMTAA